MNINDLEHREGLQGMRLWKLVEYTTQELKDEVARREKAEELNNDKEFDRVMVKLDKKVTSIGHYGHLIDVTTNHPYCSECEMYFEI